MTFAQRRNRLTTHFSERIPLVKRRVSVLASNYSNITKPVADRSNTVVKVLCYKSEGRWFDPSFLPFALWPWGRLSL